MAPSSEGQSVGIVGNEGNSLNFIIRYLLDVVEDHVNYKD